MDYLNPNLPAGLKRVQMPLLDGTPDTIKAHETLPDHPEDCRIEIRALARPG